MAFPPNFDHSWDTTQPPDTQLLNQGAADFRNLKDDVMQRLSLLSGTLANRPTPETVNATWGGSGFGFLYFATDTGQTFQWNGSAWVLVGLIWRVASVDLPGQTAAIVTTTLYNVPVSGIYQADIYMNTGPGCSGVGITIGWTDDVGANTQIFNLSGAAGSWGAPQVEKYIVSGSAFTYAMSYVSGTYGLRIRLSFKG